MKERDLDDRLLDYAARIVRVVGALRGTTTGRRIGDQLLRSGTSVGANYQEAQGAESRNDFVHKVQISLKEVRESHYWLSLIVRAELLPAEQVEPILAESRELRAMLSKAVATAKSRAAGFTLLPFAFCLLPFALRFLPFAYRQL